jgi:hypothetical protein
MALRFSVGHQGGGTSGVNASPRRAREVLDSLLRELVDSDDEHYQVFVINAAGESLTVFDNGLFAYSASPAAGDQTPLYFRPTTRDEALDVLIQHVQRDPGAHLRRFGPEPPSGGAGFLVAREAPASPLHDAARAGDLELLRRLVDEGHDVNGRDADGATPIMHAALEGQVLVCRYLIDRGADLIVRDNDGWDLLRRARGYPEIVALLNNTRSSTEPPR